MKTILLLITFCLGCHQSMFAQTFSEWFRQKATQKKYLLEQIAALKVYSEYVQKGYKISKQGLDLIGSIKDGDLKQHLEYFLSLSAVNPKIRGYPRVKSSLLLGEQIENEITGGLSLISKGRNLLNDNEDQYCQQVLTRIRISCKQQIDLLKKVIADDALQLKDDERLLRIDAIYSELQEQYAFARNFTDGILMLLRSRREALNELERGKIMYQIKP